MSFPKPTRKTRQKKTIPKTNQKNTAKKNTFSRVLVGGCNAFMHQPMVEDQHASGFRLDRGEDQVRFTWPGRSLGSLLGFVGWVWVLFVFFVLMCDVWFFGGRFWKKKDIMSCLVVLLVSCWGLASKLGLFRFLFYAFLWLHRCFFLNGFVFLKNSL